MALTTLDDIVEGSGPIYSFLKVTSTMEAIGRHHSLWYVAGLPAAATANSSGMAGEALTSHAAALVSQTPAGGDERIIAHVGVSATFTGVLLICDRLWHQSGISVTTTTAQTINSVAFPNRDLNNTSNGNGVLIGLEVSTATTNAGTTTPTLSYTNSDGVSGRTATVAPGTFPATAAAGTFVPFLLQSGDVGVQSIQSITLGTSLVSGVVHLVAYRLVCPPLMVAAPAGGQTLDALQLGNPVLFDNSVLMMIWIPGTTAVTTIQGTYSYSEN